MIKFTGMKNESTIVKTYWRTQIEKEVSKKISSAMMYENNFQRSIIFFSTQKSLYIFQMTYCFLVKKEKLKR